MKKLLTLLFLIALLVPVANCAVVPRDFYAEVSKGNIAGHSFTAIQGIDEAVGTTEYVIWPEGILYVYPVAETLMNLSSTSASDTNGGLGAWNVTVFGLDDNYVEVVETVTLNGQTPVSTVNQYFRVNRLRVGRSGASESNVGKIYIGTGATVAGVPTNRYNVIEADQGASSTAIYTVPDGYTAYIKYFHLGTDTSKIIEATLTSRCLDCPDNSWSFDYHDHFETRTIIHDLPLPFPYAEHTDIKVTGRNSVGNAFCTVDVFFLIVDNNYVNDAYLDWSNGDPSFQETQINSTTPVDVTVQGDVDISLEFLVFILIAFTLTIYADTMEDNYRAGLYFAFAILFWIATMYQWSVDHSDSGLFYLIWIYLVPLSFCILRFVERAFYNYDDVTEKIRRSRPKF